MTIKYQSFYWVLLCLFLFSSCAKQMASWTVVDRTDGVLILEEKDSVLFYQRATKSLDGQYARANYIHPLYSLHNTVLTEDFPKDHLHHRGIFWAWHQNYIGEQKLGDAWELENFSWEVTDVQVEQRPDSCILHTKVYWKSPLWLDEKGAQKPFVEEHTDITIHHVKPHYRIIDFRIELEALEDSLSIGGSEDVKGYSGFSWRIPLPEDVSFTGEHGTVTPENPAVEAGPWLDISGSLDGQAGREGVVVISHPSNPNHPQPWILRNKGSMQNVVYPGRERAPIKPKEPLILRYRMIVYDGELDEALIRKLSSF